MGTAELVPDNMELPVSAEKTLDEEIADSMAAVSFAMSAPIIVSTLMPLHQMMNVGIERI